MNINTHEIFENFIKNVFFIKSKTILLNCYQHLENFNRLITKPQTMSERISTSINSYDSISLSSTSRRTHLDSGIAGTSTYSGSQIQSPYNFRSRMNSNLTRLSSTSEYESELEHRILNSRSPIQSMETEEITVNSNRGIWLNKSEVTNWRGDKPINEYPINTDTNPEIIKKTSNSIEYIQELAIRYLRPPTPPSPEPIVITEEEPTRLPCPPPIVIRQQPPRPPTPEPLIFREAPPRFPPTIPVKKIVISGNFK